MVTVPVGSVVYHGLEHRLNQTKDYKIGICCFSPKHAALQGVRAKTGWLGIKIMCPSAVTYLPVDCFSELALIKIQPSVLVMYKVPVDVIISLNVTCSHHDVAEKLLI